LPADVFPPRGDFSTLLTRMRVPDSRSSNELVRGEVLRKCVASTLCRNKRKRCRVLTALKSLFLIITLAYASLLKCRPFQLADYEDAETAVETRRAQAADGQFEICAARPFRPALFYV
jgi:hypothetical protein